MSNPSSISLSQSSSKSRNISTSGSSRSSLLKARVANALNFGKKKRAYVDASVVDASHDNTFYNDGQMNVAYGNNVVQNINVGIDSLDALVFNMTRSLNAEFDIVGKSQRESCAPNTRQYVLKQLKTWCKKPANLLFYWLSGMPGTGKTTIVFTLCQYLRERGILGASFFCSRWVQDCRDIQLIFPTIAFQLARSYPSFRKKLAESLRKDPDIPRRALGMQLQKLIIEPSKGAEAEFPSNIVVVLDALDECSDGHASFLRILVDFAPQLPFRLVLTSRPECIIADVLPTVDPSPSVKRFILHEVEKDIVREDIVKYLQHALSSAIPPVTATAIDALANHSGSSFIIASTTARLVMAEGGDPAERLENVLRSLAAGGTSAITNSLDMLYTEILSRITRTHGSFQNEIDDIKNILFTVICAHAPLTKQAIALLWGMSESTVDRRLRSLRSVLCIPEDASSPITIFHVSFPDFITDETRAGLFYCDVATFHGKFAAACFKSMNAQLCRNICQLEGRLPNEEVSQEKLDLHISAGLAYATVHWAYHLGLYPPANVAIDPDVIRTFCSDHLLHWVECLSLLGQLSKCDKALTIFRAYVKDKSTTDLIQEVHKFVQLNYDIIDYSSAEIYFSALVWVPTGSLIRSLYAVAWEQRLPRPLRGLPTALEEALTSRVIKVHQGQVKSVATAMDGNLVVSGSDDQTVHLWNVAAHKVENIFTGHGDSISSISVPSNNTRILSASDDKTVRVWDFAKAESRVIFEGHSDIVRCVAVSRDGKLACSCDLGNSVFIWNVETAEVLHSISSDGKWRSDTRSVDFAPDNHHIVYSSQDAVQIYSLPSRSVIRTLKGHHAIIQSVAISPCGLHLLTGSSDNTAKVWKFSTGKKTRTLRGHTGIVQCVAFCHDSQRAISGSEDKSIRVWNIETGATLAVLTGHSQIVWSVSVFPDDLHAVSGSADWTMMIWDIPENAQQSKRKWKIWAPKADTSAQPGAKVDMPWSGRLVASSPTQLCLVVDETAHIIDSSSLDEKVTIHVGSLTSAAFSFQETRLAAAYGHVITVWDVTKRQKVLKIKASQQNFISVAFSHDDHRILTSSDDGQIRVWSAIGGAEQLAVRQPDVCRVAFSLDDSRIFATSSNKTACVWHGATGHLGKMIKTESWRAPSFFSGGGEYLIECASHATLIWEVASGNLVRSHDGHRDWTLLPNGVSYSILDFSWICKTEDPTRPSMKLCWIPPKYRNMRQTNTELWVPIAFPSSSGDRVFLSNIHDTVVLDINCL